MGGRGHAVQPPAPSPLEPGQNGPLPGVPLATKAVPILGVSVAHSLPLSCPTCLLHWVEGE